MTQDDRWLTPSAWGAERGMSRQAAHKAVKRLGIELRDGKLHAARATAVYTAMTRPRVRVNGRQAADAPPATAAPRAGHDDANLSYAESRRRASIATMLMAEREAARQARTLCLVADVERLWASQLTVFRSRLLNIPSRLAPQLPHEHVRQVFELLTDEIHDALTELSRTDGVPAGDDDE